MFTKSQYITGANKAMQDAFRYYAIAYQTQNPRFAQHFRQAGDGAATRAEWLFYKAQWSKS